MNDKSTTVKVKVTDSSDEVLEVSALCLVAYNFDQLSKTGRLSKTGSFYTAFLCILC